MARDINKRVKYGKSIKRGLPSWYKNVRFNKKLKASVWNIE